MSKKHIFIIKMIVLTLSAIMLFTVCIYSSNKFKDKYNSVSVRFKESNVVRKSDLKKAMENEKKKQKEVPKITAWNSYDNSEIYAYDFYKYDSFEKRYIYNSEKNIKKEKVKLYEVYGDCNEANPIDLLCGNYLIDDDIYGCIIDKETCYALFGTERGVGNSILLNKKVYYVRGVAETENKLIMINSNDMNEEFSNIELFYSNDEKSKEMSEKFLLQNNLEENFIMFDCEFYGKAVQKFSQISVWIVIIFLIKKYYNFLYGIRHNKKKNILYTFYMVVFIAILIYVTKFRFYYPLRLIPSKWSDFKFWEDRFDEVKLLMYELTYMITYERDIMMVYLLKKSIILSIISCISTSGLLYYINNNIKMIINDKNN